jgi:hypothetical protein
MARGKAALLVLLMGIGSIVLWIGVPLFWIWLASQIADSSQPSIGLYMMILVGIVASMIVLAKLLGALNQRHLQVTGALSDRREQTPWLRSMRGDRVVRRQTGVLGTVMVVSVSIALTVFGIWFFFFASGGGLPG